MTQMPEISILMGAYNCEATLEKAIESILSQTFTNWEFIVCDDGSKDSTWMMLQKYKADPRFVVLKNEKNLGLAGTLNVCFKHAKAPFIARQDADDISLPERFEKQLNFLKQHSNIDVISAYAYLVDDEDHRWGMYKAPAAPVFEDWTRGTQIIHACVMMRRKAFELVNGYNPTAIRVEDYDMWARMLKKGVVFANLIEPLYEIHWGWKDYKRKKIADRIKEIKFKYRFIKENNFPSFHFLFLLKPVLLSLLPNKFLYLYHRKKMALSGIK